MLLLLIKHFPFFTIFSISFFNKTIPIFKVAIKIIKVYSNNKQIGTYTIKDNCSSVDVKVYNLNLPVGESDLTLNLPIL